MEGERIHTFVTVIGKLCAVTDGKCLKALYLPNETVPRMDVGTDPVTEQTEREIGEYLSGKRKSFEVPVYADGSDFARKVLEQMSRIPYGSTLTYGELAKRSGRPGAARAVGSVCSHNRIPIIIPCHRVVASDGVGRYAGGTALKKRLITMEKEFR